MEMQLIEDSDKKVKCNKTSYQLFDSNARSLNSIKCPEIRLPWLCSGFAVFVILISIFSSFLYTLQTLQSLQMELWRVENSARINNVSAHLEELLKLTLSQKAVNSKLKADYKPSENNVTAKRDDKFVQVANALSSIADSVAETNEKMNVFTNSYDSNYKALMESKLDNISLFDYLRFPSAVRDVGENLEETIKKGFDIIQSWTVNSFTNFTEQFQIVTNQTGEILVQLQDTTSSALINFSGELKNVSRNTSEVIGSLERRMMESLRKISAKSSISFTSVKEAIEILDSRLDSLTNVSVTEKNDTASDSDCGLRYYGPHGNFKSKNYPNPYTNDLYCLQQFEVQDGKAVELTFENFNVEPNGSSCYDKVLIYDGLDDNSPLLKQLCGEVVPQPVRSTGRHLAIYLDTDHSETRQGYNGTYRAVDVASDSDCGQRFYGPHGNFKSKNYPHPYTNDTYCLQQFEVEDGKAVELTFENFNVEPNGRSCYDKVLIYDGLDDNSPLLKQLCGEVVPQPVRSTGRHLAIYLDTDHSVTRQGYNGTYRAVDVDCTAGFKNLGGTCYAYVSSALDWADAVAHCKSLGSILAEPKTSEEFANIQDLAVDYQATGDVWIGGNLTSGQWTWASSGDVITYLPWAPGEPTNRGRCLHLWQFQPGQLGLDDQLCHLTGAFVCQV